ncbi:carbamoyl phosphate synthase small subunit, partial [Candidatus Curtissbacteria bacterium]|nr:carbamoyl phosphate synthase small subunit [Candidatus Curtissbacteria bacterium]
ADLTTHPSHWQSQRTLAAWLKDENIPGIYGIDTRKLTQKLRERGVMLGKIVVNNQDVKLYDPNLTNLVAQVSPKELRIHKPNGWQEWKGSRQRAVSGMDHFTNMERFLKTSTDGKETPDRTRLNIGLLNCGAKRNILRNLLARGATVYELPWDYDPFANNLPVDGLIISNGPGDPKMANKSITIIKKALNKKLPTFGVCLGNQLLALAAGGNTYKLKFGHRAQNQPTIMVENPERSRRIDSKRCYITTQNHGFAVDEKKMPDGFRRWFYNANDNTNEGMIHVKLPFLSVQFHPENNPGPKDTEFLFDYFMERFK